MDYCFFNGQYIDPGKANISIFDLAVLRAWAVFDFAYARGNKVFYGQEHIQRLENSAKIAALKLPYTTNQILEYTEKLLEKNSAKESLIRWVLTGGIDEDGHQANFAILNEKYTAPSQKIYGEGIAIKTINLKREIPGAKTSNYQIRYSHLAQMKEENIFELLYIAGDQVLECTTANIFLVKDGVLHTPIEEVLPGITRRVVIDLAKQQGIKVAEKSLSLDDLKDADEVFITSTTKKILPVKKVDDNQFVAPGEITKRLQTLFESHEREYFL